VSPSEGAGAQYLGLAGLSAVAGTALTVAPQTVWELLGSTDIVTVTLNSSQVSGKRQRTRVHPLDSDVDTACSWESSNWIC
jgi:hypothetical protein